MPPEAARPVREAEQRASAAVVGVDQVDFLGLPDGVLAYGLPLRRAIAAAVRRHQPEIVITTNFRDTWDGEYAQHCGRSSAQPSRTGLSRRRRAPGSPCRPRRRSS
jgi:GlcNAc-PI de-N-acetylase